MGAAAPLPHFRSQVLPEPQLTVHVAVQVT